MKYYKEKLEQWAKEKLEEARDSDDEKFKKTMIFGAIMFGFRMGYITEHDEHELYIRYTK